MVGKADSWNGGTIIKSEWLESQNGWKVRKSEWLNGQKVVMAGKI